MRIIELSNLEKFLFSLFVWSYVSFILLFFQPFGINNYDPQEKITVQLIIVSIIIGFIAGCIVSFNEFVIERFIVRPKKLVNILVGVPVAVVLIATCIFIFYNYLGEWNEFNVGNYLEFLINVSLIGLIPIAAKMAYLNHKSLREKVMLWEAGQLLDQPLADDRITISAENKKDKLILSAKSLVYIVAADNYVEVFNLENGKLVKTLVRATLKGILAENTYLFLYQCHRSFLINLFHVEKLHGNYRNIKLKLQYSEVDIPVSRQYADGLMSKFLPHN